MRTYGTIESEIVQRLKDKIGENYFDFRIAPNTQAEFSRMTTKPTITVVYTESKFNQLSSDGTTNEEEMYFLIDIRGRSRAAITNQAVDSTVYTLIEATKYSLVGFKPTDCTVGLSFKEGSLKRFEENEWCYTYTVVVKSHFVSDDEVDLGVLLQTVIFNPIEVELSL